MRAVMASMAMPSSFFEVFMTVVMLDMLLLHSICVDNPVKLLVERSGLVRGV